MTEVEHQWRKATIVRDVCEHAAQGGEKKFGTLPEEHMLPQVPGNVR